MFIFLIKRKVETMKKRIIKKSVFSMMLVMAGIVTGRIVVGKVMGKLFSNMCNMSDKHLALFLMMNQWVKVKQEGKNLAEYLKKNGYKKIAIYGMSYAGETLLDELCETEIEIAYAIDKNAESIYSNIDIVTIEADLEKVDVVVVTAITFYDEIEERLKEKLKCPIISLEDIIYEI